MSYPTSNDLAPNAFVIRLETNQMVSPESFGLMLREIDRLAHLKSALGPNAELRIAGIGTGSIWVHIVAGLAISANIAAIGGFVLLLEERMRRKSGGLAEAIATMALDDSVVEAKIVTRDRTVLVATKELPAKKTVERKRAMRLAAEPGEYNLTPGGDPLTLDGERPTFGGPEELSDRVKPFQMVPSNWDEYLRGPSREKASRLTSKGGVAFGGQASLNDLRLFVGRLHPGRTGHSDAMLEGKSGTMFHLRFSTDLHLQDLPWGEQVVVAGVRDDEERDVIHAQEITRVTEH